MSDEGAQGTSGLCLAKKFGLTCDHRYVYYLNTTLRIISFVRTSLNMWLYPLAFIAYTHVRMYIFAGKYLDIVHAYIIYLYNT